MANGNDLDKAKQALSENDYFEDTGCPTCGGKDLYFALKELVGTLSAVQQPEDVVRAVAAALWDKMPAEPEEADMPDLARAALAALPSQDTEAWQPIETAPKDGTFIVIIGQNNLGEFWEVPEIAHWQKGLLDADEAGQHFEGWIEDDPAENMRFWNVTHWMPLPVPPTKAPGDSA